MEQLLKTYWFPTVLIVLMTFSWSNTNGKLRDEKAAHKADITKFTDAQQLANTKAEEKRKQLETEAKTQAKQADVKYSTLLANYRANLVRLKASKSSGSGPSYSYVQPTEGGDGPSEGTFISDEDADTCAVNTARLQVVQEWAVKLEQQARE